MMRFDNLRNLLLFALATWLLFCSPSIVDAQVAADGLLDLPDASPTEAAFKRLNSADVEAAKLILTELSEQVSVASAKLDQTAMTRKRRMGKLGSLIKAADEQIACVSAESQRLAQRQRQLEQDLNGNGQDGENGLTEANKQLLMRAQVPIDSAQAKLERLSRFRSQLQEEVNGLRREHIHHLLRVAVDTANEQDHFGFDALETFVEQELSAGKTK